MKPRATPQSFYRREYHLTSKTQDDHLGALRQHADEQSRAPKLAEERQQFGSWIRSGASWRSARGDRDQTQSGEQPRDAGGRFAGTMDQGMRGTGAGPTQGRVSGSDWLRRGFGFDDGAGAA